MRSNGNFGRWWWGCIVVTVLGAMACDISCPTNGASECDGAGVRVCVEQKWDYTDCYDDVCSPLGYSSASCSVDVWGGARCTCG